MYAFSPKLVIGDCSLSIVTFSNEEQFIKADEPILVTIDGIVIDSKDFHPYSFNTQL